MILLIELILKDKFYFLQLPLMAGLFVSILILINPDFATSAGSITDVDFIMHSM